MINILTYCTWTSIGSILQAYGLKSALIKTGYQSRIMLQQGTNNFHYTKIHSIRSLALRLFECTIDNKRKTAYEKRVSFIERNIDIELYESYQELAEKSDNADVIFLSGSDQIWNPNNCDPVFLQEFVKNGKRLSYAASMGNTQIPESIRDRFISNIQKFDNISVREHECAKILSKYVDKKISVNIDPTFLVTQAEWRRLETEYRIDGPYILLYMLFWNPQYKREISALRAATGLPVYAIVGGLSRVNADKFLYDVGPEEFLWLIDHAEYVITSSFHGVAFSIIFNKKFSAVINPALPSRISNILTVLDIPKLSIAELYSSKIIDYDRVERNIREEREKSINYLREILD